MAPIDPADMIEVNAVHWPSLDRVVIRAGSFWRVDFEAWDEAVARARAIMISGSRFYTGRNTASGYAPYGRGILKNQDRR
jgi:hypothetical protein